MELAAILMKHGTLWLSDYLVWNEGMNNTDLQTSPDTRKPCRTPRLKRTPSSPSTEQKPQPADDTLDVFDIAALLHFHPVTIRLKAAAAEIPGRQIGNRWRFVRSLGLSFAATAFTRGRISSTGVPT